MADLSFASWAQTPVGQAIDVADHPGALGPAAFEPGLSLTHPDGTVTPIAGPSLTMLGPEGVAGLDPRVVIRTDPPPGAGDVEDNYLASVELVPVELPWLFTPARPDAQGRLRPWIALVVVEAGRSDLRPERPLPVLRVGADQLPDLDDSWGWAHLQHPVAGAAPPPGLEALVGRAVARLVCPRRLAPSIRYRACIVPAFAGGVAAGLGLPVDPGTAHAHAWETGQADEVTLPVLYEWEFATGIEGDFEQLVRRLHPAPNERIAGLGRRLVDVARPWPDDDPLAGAPEPATLPVPGALVSLAPGPPGTVPDGALKDAAQRLTAQLNAPAERLAGAPPGDTTGAVAPPIYGGRHVSRDRVGAGTPPWVDDLSLHLPTRIAAGLGTEYIRANQETLMARAWEQVGAIREANRRRRLGQLASTVAESVHGRHIQTLQPGEAVALSAPAAWRVRTAAAGPTLATEVAVSTLAAAAATTAFTRLMRPGGPIARAAGTNAATAIERGLTGAISVPEARPLLDRVEFGGGAAAGELGIAADAAVQAGRSLAAAGRLVALQALSDTARVNGLTTDAEMLSARLDALPVDRVAVQAGNISSLRLSVGPLLQQVAGAVSGARADLGAPPAAATPAVTPFGVQVDVAGLRTRVLAALAPGDRVARRVAAQVTVPARFATAGPLDPVMAHPVFPAPMALALLASAPDWFLPGIADFPADTVTLLAVENRFVESFLVGLNHEFNRELLWREYPTDMRGSAFRSFWPRSDGVSDIPEIHDWAGGLGEHLTLGEHEIAVLLVRGSVVRRFPDMLVAAVPVLAAPAGQPPIPDTDPANWKPPLFVLPVDAQTAAYAFALDPVVLQAPVAPATPGWFFTFQEHSYRIRFGFDLPDSDPPDPGRPFDTWNDLDWDRVPAPRGFAEAGTPIDPPANAQGPGDPRWGADAADIARIALQRPFRVLIHAHELVGA